jgi:hypothetical protein
MLGNFHWDPNSQTNFHNENQFVSHLVITNLRIGSVIWKNLEI